MTANRVDQVEIPNALRDLLERVRILEATPDIDSGGGNGLQYNVGTYGPLNTGDWIVAETTGSTANTGPLGGNYGIILHPSAGMIIEGTDPALSATLQLNQVARADNDGIGVLQVFASDGGFNDVFAQAAEFDATTGPGDGSAIGISILADSTSGTGPATGASITAAADAAGGATGVLGAGTIESGTAGGFAIGVDGVGNANTTAATGPSIGVRAQGSGGHVGLNIGLEATGHSLSSGTGDTIGALITAKKEIASTSTLYGMQVFIDTTKVFQVNGDGSLHGLTGQSLVFDL